MWSRARPDQVYGVPWRSLIRVFVYLLSPGAGAVDRPNVTKGRAHAAAVADRTRPKALLSAPKVTHTIRLAADVPHC